MKRGCPVSRVVEFAGKRWTLLILLEIFRGGNRQKRYSEIKAGLKGITPKMLATRLRELEKEGLVSRKVSAGSYPIRSEYSLTKSGEDFVRIIEEMRDWSIRWKVRNPVCEDNDCRECEL